MRYLPGLFENLAPHVDGVVALDDQSVDDSADFVASQPSVLELLTVPPGSQGELEDGRNHRALTEAAWEHDPDWLLGIDADERLEMRFRERAETEIGRAEARGRSALWVRFCELWDGPTRFRSDGIWGQKRKACLFAASRGHRFHDMRVHAHWASVPEPRRGWPQADLRVYHLRMLDPADRLRRVERYARIDPRHECQPIGYDYMLDEEGLALETIQPDRMYQPIGR